MLGTELLLGPWSTSGLLGLVTIILLYWFSKKNHDYWEKRGIPFVKPMPFLGSVKEIFSTPIHEVELERYFKYGLVYGYFEGRNPLLSVADPVLLRDIFVKDFYVFSSRRLFITGNEIFDKMVMMMKGDEEWKRIRSIITPTFTTGKIKKMLSIFTDCSTTLVKNFQNASKEGKPVDAKRLYGAFTMDVIASSAFSTKIDSHNDPDNNFVKLAKKFFTQQLNWKFIVLLVCPRFMEIFKIDILHSDVMDFFQSVTLQIVEERKRTGQVRNDFLQLLLDTAKEVADDQKGDLSEKGDITCNYGQDEVNPQIFKNVTSKNLSMTELVAQCVIFFIAGYDSTASTLSFVTYFLALNPDIQDKLRKEVDEAIKKSEGKLTYEAIQSMTYLDNVISETLRMYPPLAKIERLSYADYKLGETGITIPKGMLISIPVYAIHRDPKIFPDPEKFDPDRFTPEERAKRHQYTFLPFGAGPRSCVAMRFALVEVKTCIAHVIANFNIKRCPETKVPLKFGTAQALLQPTGIVLEMEIRNDSPLVK